MRQTADTDTSRFAEGCLQHQLFCPAPKGSEGIRRDPKGRLEALGVQSSRLAQRDSIYGCPLQEMNILYRTGYSLLLSMNNRDIRVYIYILLVMITWTINVTLEFDIYIYIMYIICIIYIYYTLMSPESTVSWRC